MTKLWQKNNKKSADDNLVYEFTAGKDRDFDLLLASHDVKGSLAHAQMLCSIGLISDTEWKNIESGLKGIEKIIVEGKFKIDDGVEDVHSQVEIMLTEMIGEAGKKIHSGRSRNDQVLLDIKLYLRDEIKTIKQEISTLFDLLIQLADKHKNDLLPGYTHFQLAMPSSFGLWFSAYAESLSDDMEWLVAAFNICNKNPLGSGAGYGSSFPLDREMTTKLLGFETMNYNVVNAQMTRGKAEKSIGIAMAAFAATLSKLSYDGCIYMNQLNGFISFPESLTTGSSIMPHKKNPDVFELIRAKCNRIQSIPNELTLLLNNLPSGYHRDLQLTKEIIFPAIQELLLCIKTCTYILKNIIVKKDLLDDEKFLHLFSVERVNELVIQGIPFRDAYKKVAEEIESGDFKKPSSIHHTHSGSIGNLCLDKIIQNMQKTANNIP